MLSLNVYEQAKRDIQDTAKLYTKQLHQELVGLTHIRPGVRKSYDIANEYHKNITQIIFKRLQAVGNHAVDFYGSGLSAEEKAKEVSQAMDELVHNKYYGLTLPQRLKESNLVLRHNIKRSAVTGAKLETRLANLGRVLTKVYPFGAHQNWDTRLFLAEAVRLEHTLARRIAYRKNIKLVRWTLSHVHTKEDICDRLATAVDKSVEHYIAIEGLRIEASGVYFVADMPKIPHPNCQCTVKYIKPRKTVRKPSKPSPNLIQRIVEAIWKRLK